MVKKPSLSELIRADLQRFLFLQEKIAGERIELADWLNLLSPRFVPMLLFRLSSSCQQAGLSPVAKLLSLANFTLFGIEIATRCQVKGGLFLPHTQGTVIGAWSIGENATIYQGVTIGAIELDLNYSKEARPTIGDNVLIGAGAVIIGNVHVGDGSRIGARCLLMETVPNDSLVIAPRAVIRANPLRGDHT